MLKNTNVFRAIWEPRLKRPYLNCFNTIYILKTTTRLTQPLALPASLMYILGSNLSSVPKSNLQFMISGIWLARGWSHHFVELTTTKLCKCNLMRRPCLRRMLTQPILSLVHLSCYLMTLRLTGFLMTTIMINKIKECLESPKVVWKQQMFSMSSHHQDPITLHTSGQQYYILLITFLINNFTSMIRVYWWVNLVRLCLPPKQTTKIIPFPRKDPFKL